MRILFISSVHNSLSQRLSVELSRRGHAIALSIGATGDRMCQDVERSQPELILAPMLKAAIPEAVWREHLCLIVHPGIAGDRGPSSLDWAIAGGESRWGVTVLQAVAEMDAGPIWATETFAMPHEPVTKSSLYRAEVTEAAVRAVLLAVARVADPSFVPEPLDYNRPDVRGQPRPSMRQSERAVEWSSHTTEEIVRRVRAADSNPGVLMTVLGQPVYVYGAHPEGLLRGPAGQVIAQRTGAVCVGTVDGAVWFTHAKAKARTSGQRHAGIKLPATQVLQPWLRGVPHSDVDFHQPVAYRTYRDIEYWEHGQVGFLAFDFYNGAMSTEQCRRLASALRYAGSRPTRVLCLLGGRDFWSNGIHLNVIEAADQTRARVVAQHQRHRRRGPPDPVRPPARDRRSARQRRRRWGDAGPRRRPGLRPQGVVLNPHYRTMGNLYGSEYWTYTLPRRVGAGRAREITTACQPMGTDEACEIGLLDAAFGADADEFLRQLEGTAESLAADPSLACQLLQSGGADRRTSANGRWPATASASWRTWPTTSLGPDPAYHEARRRFVRKEPSADSAGSGSVLPVLAA